MPTVRANGLDIGYDIDAPADGDETTPTLVLLHGATSIGADDWAAQRPLLARTFRSYLPDARGHGRTRWDAAQGWTHDQLVEDLEAFVDALGIERFHLAGFSMGGMTALTYAARHPERLRTLLVAAVTTQREPRTSVARRLLDPARADADLAWKATLARRHDPGQGVDTWRRLLPAIAADVDVHPLLTPGEMRRIDVPTLLCVGDRDPFAPVDHVWGMKRQLPQAQLFVAPDCGHEVMARRPALFNQAMMAFYRAAEG
jgi:pimeloyl-ACP methyl ester carboxylesterase